MAEATKEPIAFLGLGIMGAPMAANLARAGFEVHAYNRTEEKADALAAEHGSVTAAATPAEAARGALIAISMVPDTPEVEAVLFGENGAAEGLESGALVIDMSTIAPTASRSIGERLAERGLAFVDAPVTGSRPKAEAGTLTIIAGGEPQHVERARPALGAMGRLVVHAGPTGHGSMAKLINNTLAAVNAAALAEGVTIARAAGLDLDALRQVVGAGSGASAMLELKAGPMVQDDFEPLFKLEHMLKDVRHLLAEARALGVATPVAATAAGLYEDADRRGLGSLDFAAVIKAVQAAEKESE